MKTIQPTLLDVFIIEDRTVVKGRTIIINFINLIINHVNTGLCVLTVFLSVS